ncbi:low affinity immunoglobulin epsilon Fc receptor-like isoform X2 [Mizuhopecten yessoensis]|uniref:low affinity immunoglobulin epsilon Fc receptor-like isoform X2 n=1 Tax=Mizuhopecten yessoensis TaxID=6573 RepID=UPI000B459F75|nr:low affinity immunoglobulin epsilon Fc receptor-like isoform X2 [Mizuhopecten yessoensis]
MKCVVLMLIVLLQVDASYQQNILPEHKRRHCNALQTSDIMEHALPEIRRILQTEAEKNRRLLQTEAENNRRLLQTEAENNRLLLQTEAENNRRLHEEHVSTLRGVILLRCDPGWLYNANHCYLFSQSRKTWQEAIEKCQDMNAYLADIQSDEENRFVKMELSRRHEENPELGDYFLGGYLSTTERKWIWRRTGEQFGYTDWAPNEPNNHQDLGEECLMLYGRTLFQWNDVRCSKTFFFICKKSVRVTCT